MGTKNIAISEEAYQRLKALKKAGESFTEVIERMTQSRGILELAGVLSESEGRRAKKAIEGAREERSRRISALTARLG